MIGSIVMIGFEQMANMIVISDLFNVDVKRGRLKRSLLVLLEVAILFVYNLFELSGPWMLLVYMFMVLGIKIIYKEKVSICILFCLIAFLIVSAIELLFYIPFALCWRQMIDNTVAGVIGTSGTFICAFFVHQKHLLKWKVISDFVKSKHKILCYVCIVAGLIMLVAVSYFGIVQSIPMYGFLFLILLVVIIFPMASQFMKNEIELRERSKYEKPMLDVIGRIRQQQHQFDNHLSAIYGMINNYKSYDELVFNLKNYMSQINEVDLCYRLLNIEDPILSGFLSVKLSEAKNKGIDIFNEISVKSINTNIPIPELLGVIGNIFDNAIEEIESNSGLKKIEISIYEEKECYIISISNPCRQINVNEVSNFFKKGYSTKGDSSNRGIGLFNVKNVINHYKGKVIPIIENRQDNLWLLMKIKIKRLTQ